MPKIRVIDVQTGQCLFECSMVESDKAYHFAAEMEKIGLDIKVQAPTLSQTLSSSLGLSQEAQAAYEESLEEEIEQHESSCCLENSDPNKTIN